MGAIITDEDSFIQPYRLGTRRALLINPPVYDAQYWARWSQPAGLLRIATLLKQKGYHVDLIDCMETNERGMVPKARRRDVYGSLMSVQQDNIVKPIYHFGLSSEAFEQQLRTLEAPDEDPDHSDYDLLVGKHA